MPWKPRNPFSVRSEEPDYGSEPQKPATLIEVDCQGCKAKNQDNMINVRVEHKDNGKKRKSCWKCNTLIEVRVDAGGGVRVWQTIGHSKQETSYVKVWQEGEKK